MGTPFFSIITVSLNSADTIAGTIRSVLSQTTDDYEIIVKDGMSSDGTIEQIPKSDRIRVIRKADRSVYDGMNQAMEYAAGRYLLFLNCGDTLYDPDVLQKVKTFITERGIRGGIVYGDCHTEGKTVRQEPVMTRDHLAYVGGLCHQTVFFSAESVQKCGQYDTALKICADHEFMFRAFVAGVEYYHIDQVICEYEGGGLSALPDGVRACRREGYLIRKKYLTRAELLRYYSRRIKKRILK